MKTNALVLRSVTLAVTLSTLLLAVAPIQAGPGAPRTSPPNSKSYGRSLAEWLGTYWRWYYTGADPETNLAGAETGARGVDWFNNPQTRSFVFSVTLNR